MGPPSVLGRTVPYGVWTRIASGRFQSGGGLYNRCSGGGAVMADELQFDRTERTETAAVALCGYCGQPLDGTYYQINGRAACQSCHAQLMASLEKHGPVVSFVVATAFGAVAAALGSL